MSTNAACPPLAQTVSQDASRLRQRFLDVRQTTLRLAEPFSAEDQMLQSMPDASPVKWHLAHTTWFFESFVLQAHVPGYKPFDSRYQYLFNSYYKQLGGHPYRGARGLMSRPSLQEVHAYRRHIDQALAAVLETIDEVAHLVELGLNHEQQHQELILTDIKHGLWSGPLPPEFLESGLPHDHPAPDLRWVDFSGGIESIGHEGSGFAFDNEGPRHEVLLRPFALASRPVTNGEYLEFMQAGGYRRPELWLSDGWDVVCAQQWNAPLYWQQRDDGSWWEFTANGMLRLDSAAPACHISYYEADAYGRWWGARLPLEEEWEIAARQFPAMGTMQEEGVFRPRPVQGDGLQQSPLQQMFGDVWEWTASPYVAYPGFKPAAGALGEYNGKFMCSQMVLRGGSCATPASHIRATYRNFFPPHARWQFSGIRMAK